MKWHDFNYFQAQWAQYLSRFAFKWTHKARSTMDKANTLAHKEDHAIGVEGDNKGVTIISPDHIKAVQVHNYAEEIKWQVFDALVTG